VLRPTPDADLEPRTASADLALLYLTLEQPSRLPDYTAARLGDDLDGTLGRLVVDGVLEVEHEGEFLSGPAAAEVVLSTRSAGGSGRIGELSIAAMRYGEQLTDLPVPLLAMRLYLYGHRPVSAALRRRLPDRAAVTAFLGVATDEWDADADAPGKPAYWRTWRPSRLQPGSSNGAGGTWKLYVSPALDALPDAVNAVAGSLAGARGVSAFKAGATLPGLCRPDKLVVYCDDLDDLREAAERLRTRLDGLPAHGVPFTAPVTSDGLISWGADPPTLRSTSWRMWVTERLAEYLVAGRQSDAPAVPAWQFALDRLRLSGIDTDTWAPATRMWPQALATS
jgi:hypothetical protein